MNRNLHSPTKLTEFARDFDIEPDTFLSKFVNKITNVYNSGYNSVNVVPTTSAVLNVGPTTVASAGNSQNSTPTHSSSDTSSKASSSTSLSSSDIVIQKQNNKQASINSKQPTVDRMEKQDSDKLTDLPTSSNLRSYARTPTSVIQRISNLMAVRNNNNLTSYKDTELHQFWMPDAKSKECYECSQKFSTFRRKHHCRLCGQIFCSKCCNQVVPGKIINCSGDLKVCTYCSKIVLTYLKSSEINSDLKSDLQALQDDLSNKLQSQTGDSNTMVQESVSPQRKVSVGYQEERLLSQPKYSLSNADRRNILQQSTSLKVLYEDMSKGLPNQNRGTDIIAYLITKSKSSNKSQAMAILTAMIEAGYIVEFDTVDTNIKQRIGGVNENENSGQSSDNDIFSEFSENNYYKLVRVSEIASNSNTNQSDVAIDCASVYVSRSEPSVTGVDGLMRSHENSFSISQFRELDIENTLMSTTGSKSLQEAFCKHEELLLTQLLRNENLDESWSKTLLPICARIVNTLPPEMIGMDLMDIRNYVNFKKVPDGARKECCIVGGAVFSKNVVHKEMATIIDQARILLLQCPIVYQRVEGKFVSIETLLLQEREYLTNVVGRIRSLGPNVIFVHKNVSGIAQDMLRACRITLVVDVKLSVLKRLARCLQCDIVSSIDSNIGRPKLGVCGKFHIRSFSSSLGISKTLMFVETPSSPRGCSVLLRGGNFSELVRVKRVAEFSLFARYNWRLEMSFLLDEFARPPSPKPSIFDSKDYSPCADVANALNDASAFTSSDAERKTSDHFQSHEKNVPGNGQQRGKKILIEKKSEEKMVMKENVQDFSDPLRAADLSPSAILAENSVKFAVELPCDNRFRTALNSTILSISPFSQFPLPYLETEAGRKCALRLRFPNELYYSKQWSENVERNSNVDSTMTKHKQPEENPPHEFLTSKIVASADSRDFQTLLASFRASGGILKKKAKMEKINRKPDLLQHSTSCNAAILKDALDINNHQRLPILFCSFYYSPEASSSFCVHPFLLNMYFYGENDIMLGQFLERYCFRSSYICSSCKLPMLDHVRRYVHSMGCVTVKLTEDFQGKNDKQILMTSWCSKCQEMTPSVGMQKDTWCLSFGKYLEMRFHNHAYRRRRLETTEAEKSNSTSSNCSHSLHRDYVQYFSFNGIVASFSYTQVEVWEINLPSLMVALKSNNIIDSASHVEEIKSFSARGYEVYATIYDKLAQLSSDIEFPMLNGLKRTLNNDQLKFREKVGVVQTLLVEKSINAYDVNDAMLMAKKLLAENIETWVQRLSEASIQSRAMGAVAAKPELSTSPVVVKSPQHPSSLQIDPGTICTEDLRSDPESPNSAETPDSKLFYSREISADSDASSIQRNNSTDGNYSSKDSPLPVTPNVVERDTKTSISSDKKSVKTILRDLLPSDKSAQHLLQSPLSINEHLTLTTGHIPVLVHDQDFSSVISYSLASIDYKKILESLSFCEVHRKSYDSAIDTDDKDSAANTTATSQKETDKDKKSKSTQAHVEITFQDSTTQFTCKIYFARDFDSMRNKFLKISDSMECSEKQCGGSGGRKHANSEGDARPAKEIDRKSSNNSINANAADSPKCDDDADDDQKMETERVRIAFARSLSKSVRWEARGGKSGSKFCKTLDDRFVLKEMTKHDVSKFENFAPHYFDYINQCLQQNHPTLLAKIFGVYRVTIKKKDNVQEKSLLIMENLFYDCDISNKFDLKGSVRNRLVDPTNQTGDEIVLLDENLIKMSWSKPLYTLTHSKIVLREAINRDATFLERNDVMDYSLLVGLNSAGRLLVLGIIDYIRTYTLDKRLESLVKTGFMGKQGGLPTIVSPKVYRQRFSEAMDRYFLAVPDRWEGLEKDI